MCKICINSADPTKLGGVRHKAMVEFRKKLREAEKIINDFILSLTPAKQVIPDGPAINRVIYTYDLDASRLESLQEFILRVLNDQFLTGRQRTFLTPYVTQGYMKGASDTISRIARLAGESGESDWILSRLQVEQIALSPSFQNRVGLVLARTFNSMEKFSGDLSVDLGRVIADGMTRGISPRRIADTISQKFDTSYARAMTIARTEVNNALRSAKEQEAKEVRKDLDLDVRLLVMSALLPERTRRWHAERHGTIVTIEENEEFYSRDGNAISCYCSHTEVIVKSDGTIYDSGLIDQLKKERVQFLGLAA